MTSDDVALCPVGKAQYLLQITDLKSQPSRERKVAQGQACVMFALGRLHEEGIGATTANKELARQCYEQVLLMGDTIVFHQAIARLARLGF